MQGAPVQSRGALVTSHAETRGGGDTDTPASHTSAPGARPEVAEHESPPLCAMQASSLPHEFHVGPPEQAAPHRHPPSTEPVATTSPNGPHTCAAPDILTVPPAITPAG